MFEILEEKKKKKEREKSSFKKLHNKNNLIVIHLNDLLRIVDELIMHYKCF